MELMEVILSKDNLNRAYKKVVANKGASGIDEVTVEELGSYIRENQESDRAALFCVIHINKSIYILLFCFK